MNERFPVDETASQAWVAVAHSARILFRVLSRVGDPAPGSNFTRIHEIYPHEKASDWYRQYLIAALEHLLLWADYVAPLKFHPDHAVTHTLRPAYTLARAALESSSHAVWMTADKSVKECARRHLSLIRWDYEEHRKSVSGTEAKKRIADMDATLVRRVGSIFTEGELRRTNHYQVLRGAATSIGYDPDKLEQIWRAASGSAHGKAWPSLDLQHVFPLIEYEPGQYRTFRLPDTGKITKVLEVADKMTCYGVLRYADFCGADIPTLLKEANRWLSLKIPIREDADPDAVARFTAPNE